jgi:glycerol-3-phosphate dehydrogenase (NAD(P)+)
MSFLVLGAGSWGTAIALHLSRLHPQVYLWDRDAKRIAEMKNTRENIRYLPGIFFPDGLTVVDKYVEAENIIIAVPSHAFREIVTQLKPYFTSGKKLICITKGLDGENHQLLHQAAKQILGEDILYAVLSGPSFAKEVAMALPTAVTLAVSHQSLGKYLISVFHSPCFRVYLSEDITGVELGGAVKNVLAVAVGMAEGLACGANAQAALITRGLAEMMRLGLALGAMPETLTGLSGVGDLILTCTNNQSRNRRFGMQLGQGQPCEAAEKSINQVVEGIHTAREIYYLSRQHAVEMPITQQVYQVLYENLSPQQALKNLLMREPKQEILSFYSGKN